MGFPSDCCGPICPTVPPVNIPGSPGASAYTFTTAAFVVPAVGEQVTVQVLNTSGLIVGESLILTGPANFTVAAIYGPTTVSLTFTGASGNISVGTVIPSGASVVPTGQQGPPGQGQNGYGTTTYQFQVPSVGNSVTVPVVSSDMFVAGQYVITNGPANFLVKAIPTSTSVTLQFLGIPGDVLPGFIVASPSNISPSGEAGGNAWSTLLAQITLPAANTTVTANVSSTQWMTVGATVVMPGPAHFTVASITDSANVVLTYLGLYQDLAPSNTIPNNSIVSPSGPPPAVAQVSPQQAFGTGTAYTFTGSLQQIVFGTSQASIALPTSGTWYVIGTVVLALDNLVIQSNVFSIVLNSSAQGNLNNSKSTIAASTGGSGVEGYIDTMVVMPLIYTTATTGDVLNIFGSQTGGSTFVTANQACIVAFRIA